MKLCKGAQGQFSPEISGHSLRSAMGNFQPLKLYLTVGVYVGGNLPHFPSGEKASYLGPVRCVSSIFADDTQCDVVRAGLMFLCLMSFVSSPRHQLLCTLLAGPVTLDQCVVLSSVFTVDSTAGEACCWPDKWDMFLGEMFCQVDLGPKCLGSGAVGWPQYCILVHVDIFKMAFSVFKAFLCWGGVGGGGWRREREATASLFSFSLLFGKKCVRVYV